MSDHQYIVGIGASAGGVEALSKFFDRTPVDRISYVIVPHLSVDFKSRMTEILSMHSKLEVMEATEGIKVEVNKVYLIPNTKYMGIKNGRLFLIEKSGYKPPHMTIDTFFMSLAEERGNKAIGVILSGVGSDGTKGGRAIQKAGGIVLVQEPTDAKFDGMPNAAIAADYVDYILPVEEMPMAIEQYVQEGQTGGHTEEDPVALSDEFLSSVVTLIKEHHPFDFSDYKVPTLQRRIKRRMVHYNLNDEDGYYSFLKKNPQEFEMLINDFLIGVTSFFRNPEAFQILENDVIPQIIGQKAKGEVLKIWVAGCATGEEAYSIAILVKEYLIKAGRNIDVKIFATDINRVALDQASKGVFTDKIVQSVSEERLEKFFEKTEESYRVKPELRKMMIFAHHDLTKNPPYCNIDLISCRNMLIYMKPILQKQVLARLTFGLRKEGFLFLGSSENISVAKDEFLELSAKWKIFQSVKNEQTFRQKGYLNTAITNIQPDLESMAIPKTAVPPPRAIGGYDRCGVSGKRFLRCSDR